ncbi:hypothetical protein HYX17_04795 [Candidatus Woesearchaeota archaeon]|nr:hypothetical protein [Candidatus Woesearchaeota archaeon]
MESELELLKKSEEDLEWFNENYEELKEDYDNEFVAIKEGEVISHDKDFERLLNKLKTMKENPAKVIIMHVSKIKLIL